MGYVLQRFNHQSMGSIMGLMAGEHAGRWRQRCPAMAAMNKRDASGRIAKNALFTGR